MYRAGSSGLVGAATLGAGGRVLCGRVAAFGARGPFPRPGCGPRALRPGRAAALRAALLLVLFTFNTTTKKIIHLATDISYIFCRGIPLHFFKK